ncbi:hypothetical protein [Pantanalinema sp. GBBB05]|uniref:hypothetical protein n=1 Tax=Pantanalinema sp. GBBB05 TaxID=2604139 RepID=UPI001D94BC63|nr:hypothetical protein [Pantanalinema sp. GBBB05]
MIPDALNSIFGQAFPANFMAQLETGLPGFTPMDIPCEDMIGWGLEGAILNTELRVLLQAIKAAGAYCRGEQELAQTEAWRILTIAFDALKGGWIRGLAISVIKALTGSSAFATLGFMVCTQLIPTLLKVMQNEMTLEEAVSQVGLRPLLAGLVTTVALLFPAIGMVLVSAVVLRAIWQEISPEWKESMQQTMTDNLKAAQQSVDTLLEHVTQTTWNWAMGG